MAFFDIGNIIHKALELYTREMIEKGENWGDVSEAEQSVRGENCILRAAQEYRNDLLHHTERDSYLITRLQRILQRTIWAITKQMERGQFTTVESEISFEVMHHTRGEESEEGLLRLVGKIDRADKLEQGDISYIKIVDYKTGKKNISLSDLYYGLQMQLLVYLKAGVDKENQHGGDKRIVIPAGVLYYHIGTFMNGNDRGAGKLTVTQIDPRSVNVRLEAFRTLDAGEVSTIFEGVGYPFEDGIYIDVAGERVRFIKETQGYYTLDVPGVLRQEWDIILNYESRYVLLEEGLEGAAEIGRFTGTYTKDLGSYSEALILSAEEGALRYQVGNSYHGGWMTSLCPEYSITGNELRATKEDRTYTFVLNEDGSITFTASDIDFYNGVYERNDEYDETEEYPEGYP